jgi:hypothetical protein
MHHNHQTWDKAALIYICDIFTKCKARCGAVNPACPSPTMQVNERHLRAFQSCFTDPSNEGYHVEEIKQVLHAQLFMFSAILQIPKSNPHCYRQINSGNILSRAAQTRNSRPVGVLQTNAHGMPSVLLRLHP